MSSYLLNESSPAVRSRKCADAQAGVTLLEVTVATAILSLVVWGSLAFLSGSKRLAHQASAGGAITSYQEKLVQEIFYQVRQMMAKNASKGNFQFRCVYPICFSNSPSCENQTCSVPGPHVPANSGPTFSPGHLSAKEFAAVLSFYNALGIFHWMIPPSGGGGIMVPNSMPTDVAAIPAAANVYQRCRNPTVNSAGSANHSGTSRFYFCVMASANSQTVSQTGTSQIYAPFARTYSSQPDAASLLSMTPIIIEFSYFSVLEAPYTVAGTTYAAGPITLGTLAALQPSYPPSKTVPIVDYLYYNFHWAEPVRSGTPMFHSYLGYVAKGEGWY